MGADIYLSSVTDAARAKYEPLFKRAVRERDRAHIENDKAKAERVQKRVSKYYDLMSPPDGYFRDSYNCSSLFHYLGWSWWQMGDEVLDGDGNLPIENAKDILAKLEAVQITPAEVAAYHKNQGLDDTPEAWFEYFTDKQKRFAGLLRKSIELNEPLYWSI